MFHVLAALIAAPVAFDTLAIEEARLSAPDGATLDYFGTAVAVDGDTAVVGAVWHDGGGITDTGAAYVFVRNGTTWTQQAKLVGPDALAGDRLGISVAIDGDTIVAGATEDDHPGAMTAGSAYVWVRSGTTWIFESKLLASDRADDDRFGWSIAIDGDTVVVGARLDSHSSLLRPGSAYVFVRNGTAWSQQAKLGASPPHAQAAFGASVAVSGDTVVVGAADDQTGPGVGLSYAFVRTGTSWSQEAVLAPTDQPTSFGSAVTVDGETAIVGAQGDSQHVFGLAGGSAYVFERSGTAWSSSAKLIASDTGAFDQFGTSLQLDGDTVVIGADGDNHLPSGNEGSSYVFRRGGSGWIQLTKIEASDASIGSRFGYSAAISGDTLIAGARWADPNAIHDSGAAYVLRLSYEYPSFCDTSDDALLACPCSNPGHPNTGCDNAQSTGGVFACVTSQDTNAMQATITASGFAPTGSPRAIVVRSHAREATPQPFADGVRCVALQGFARLAATTAVGGTSVHTFGHGVGPGTYHYQVWFGYFGSTFCSPAAASNLSNGRSMTW